MKKTFKLSIVMSDKSYVCNNINDQDVIIKEFDHYDQAHNYIDHNFKKIKEGWNYNHYIKKGAQAPTTKEENMKKLTEKQLIKILTEILPSGYDKKSVEVKKCPYSNSDKIKEVSAIDEVLGRKVWFYYWKNEKNEFHLSMDGACSWDYLSSESDHYIGYGEYIEAKFVKLFEKFDLYPHPQNHYSYVVGDN